MGLEGEGVGGINDFKGKWLRGPGVVEGTCGRWRELVARNWGG